MEVQHVNVKLFLEGDQEIDFANLIPVFHSWIRDQVFEELLIDAADYRHVAAGPGVVLVGHEANYSLDNCDDRPGVRYNRKALLAGSNQDRFRQAMSAGLVACQRLEENQILGGKIRFNQREMELCINDRLLAPNTQDTYRALEPDLEVFCSKLFAGGSYHLRRSSDPRSLFSLQISSDRRFSPSQLLENLSSSS
jgi:hypothetical protein